MTKLRVPGGEVVDFGDAPQEEIEAFMYQQFPELRPDVPLVPDSVERGFHNLSLGVSNVLHSSKLKSDESFAQDVSDHARKMIELPRSLKAEEQMSRLQESEGVLDWAKNFATSPNLIGETFGESVGMGLGAGLVMLPAGKVVKLPAWGTRLLGGTVFGASSGATEAAGQLFGDLEEAGYDTSDPEAVQMAFADPEYVKYLKDRSLKAGIGPAVFDGLTATIAGLPWKMFRTPAKEMSIATRGLAGTTELGIQGFGGAAGAATSQMLIDGEITDWTELGMEFAMELVGGGPQAVFTTLAADSVNDPVAGQTKEAYSKAMGKITREQRGTALGEKRIKGAAPVDDAAGTDTPVTAPSRRVQNKEKKLSKMEADYERTKDSIEDGTFDWSKLSPNQTKYFKDLKKNIKKTKTELKKAATPAVEEKVTATETKKAPSKRAVSRAKKAAKKAEAEAVAVEEVTPKKITPAKRPIIEKTKKGTILDSEPIAQEMKKYETEEGVFDADIYQDLTEKITEVELQRDQRIEEFYRLPYGTDQEKADRKTFGERNIEIDKENLIRRNRAAELRAINEGRPLSELQDELRDPVAIEEFYRDLERLDKDYSLAVEKRDKLVAILQDPKAGTKKTQEAQFKLEGANNIVELKYKKLAEGQTKLNEEVAKFQRTQRLTSTPTSDFVQYFGPRLRATTYSPKSAPTLEKAARKVLDILQRVGGPTIDAKIVAELALLNEAGTIEQSIRGAQYLNQAVVALAQENPTETAYHEAWHWLNRSGFFKNPRVKDIIKNDLPLYRDLIVDRSEILSGEFDAYMATEQGREELAATAFGLVAFEWDTAGKVSRGTGLSRPSHNLFKRIHQMMKEIWSTFRGMKDVNSLDDLFVDSFNGEMAVHDLVEYDNVIRTQGTAAVIRQAATDNHYDVDQRREDIRRDASGKRDSLADIGNVVRFMRTKYGLAEKDDTGLLAKGIATQQKRTQDTHALVTKYNDIAASFFQGLKGKKQKAVRYGISQIMAHNNKEGQKSIYNEDGTMSYYEDGDEVIVTNLEAVKAYKALQDAAKAVLNDYEDIFRYNAVRAFSSLDKDFSMADIDALIEDKNTTDTEKASLITIKENILNFGKMQSRDHTPHLRFGDNGVAIYKKDASQDNNLGELVFLGTVETYKPPGGKSQPHPKQLEALKQEIKDKGYTDTDKYIIRKGGGEATFTAQTDIDNLELFYMSRDKENSLVNSQFSSMDTLESLIGASKLDEKAVAEMRSKITNDLIKRTFDRQFAKSETIDGYNTDWDRVWNAFFGGAAINISHMKHQEVIEQIKETAKRTGPAIHAEIEKYFEYVSQVQEDQQGLRAFNFSWGMGLNPSTAALQYMNLPTFTLGSMGQFSMNPVKNMALITKWGRYGGKFVKNGAVRVIEGSPVILIDDQKTWDQMRAQKKNKHLTDEQFTRLKNFAIELYRNGVLGAVLVEENTGTTFKGEMTEYEKGKNLAQKGIQFSGSLIAIAEQNTRFATALATAELLITNEKAAKRAQEIYGGNPEKGLKGSNMYREQVKTNPNMLPEEAAALYTLHRSHAVFGKDARPDMFKSVGGSVFMPFMTWPVFIWGLMDDMAFNRGPTGKVGLATALGVMYLAGGATGMPGADFLKELLESLYGALTGDEIDAIDSIHEMLGGGLVAETATHGLLMSLGQMHVSPRMALPAPFEVFVNPMLGVGNGDPTAQYGMLGSVMKNLREGFDGYMNGTGMGLITPELFPSQVSNMLKSLDYAKHGVRTTSGKTTLMTPEETDPWTIISRFFGVTDANVARRREEHWFKQLKSKEHQQGYMRLKNKIINEQVRFLQHKKGGDTKKAAKSSRRLEKYYKDLGEWAVKKKYSVPVATLNKNINTETWSRFTGNYNLKKVAKSQRYEVFGIEEREKKRFRGN
jgi:hypothetical protein